MSGDNGKRKRSSSSASAKEHRGVEEVAPKIRKIAQEDMGKREGKLQVKGKMRRLEEKADEAAAVAPTPMDDEAADNPARRMTREEIAVYEAVVVEKDGDHMMMFPEPEHATPPLFVLGGGAIQLGEVNAAVVPASVVGEFEERAATRLEEFEAKGFLDYYPEHHSEAPSCAVLNQGDADAQAIDQPSS